MKKTTFNFLFILLSTFGYSQGTYSNYLDYTSEWRSYASGWTGFNGFDSYETVYFDGDISINGNIYYKQYRKVVETNYNSPFQGTYTETFLYGPGYVREDNTGKVWYLSSDNTEHLLYDNQAIQSAQLGDAFPATNATPGCQVTSIQTVMLGTIPLKQLFGAFTTNNSGIVEGIGSVGNYCAVGYHYDIYLNCYTKQSTTIQFGSLNCDSFPVPIRTNLSTATNNYNAENIAIYPNPTSSIVYINSTIQTFDYKIYNNVGLLLKKGSLENENKKIDLSTFPNGVYYLKLTKDNLEINKKLVKE